MPTQDAEACQYGQKEEWIESCRIESGQAENLVQVRQDLFCFLKPEKLLDIVIQASRCVEHGLKY